MGLSRLWRFCRDHEITCSLVDFVSTARGLAPAQNRRRIVRSLNLKSPAEQSIIRRRSCRSLVRLTAITTGLNLRISSLLCGLVTTVCMSLVAARLLSARRPILRLDKIGAIRVVSTALKQVSLWRLHVGGAVN